MMQGSLAERLRVLRAQRGLTLVEAADKTGIGRDTLSDLERGRRHPVMPTLAKIARGYDVPVEELLEEAVPLGETLAGLTKEEEEEADAFAEAVLREIETHGRTGSFKEIIARVAQRELSLPKQAASPTAEAPRETGPSLLDKVLTAVQRDEEKDSRAMARLGASEGIPQSASEYEEDKVRAELRSRGFPDEFFEDLLWPLAVKAARADRLERERVQLIEELNAERESVAHNQR